MPKGRTDDVPNQPTFGRALRWMRQERRLTQEQLAGEANVSQPAYSRWETDESYPSVSNLPGLARALGCEIFTLLRLMRIDPGKDESLHEWAARISQQQWESEQRRRQERLEELERLREESKPRQDFKEMALSVR